MCGRLEEQELVLALKLPNPFDMVQSKLNEESEDIVRLGSDETISEEDQKRVIRGATQLFMGWVRGGRRKWCQLMVTWDQDI